ncbi:hypothetical protein CY35_06G032800 [Sphagnum magellanicum]|nr:hypothetical protein CY35_06G032800 [Sphagnum magellanicum]
MDSIIKKLQELEREARALQEKEKEQVYSQLQTTPAGNVNDRQEVSSGWPSGSFNQEFPCTPVPLCPTRSKEAFEGDGDGDWWTAFRKKAGPWKGEKLVVLSLFDGIGGIWAALTRLGIPFVGYSSEVSPPAIQVVKARYPDVHHVGDVRKLDRTSFSGNVDLVVGGFPCQDLSAMGRREGLHGQRSKLFFDLLRVLKEFKPKWFLVENVASMTWIDREEISKYLRVHPIELDSIELTPTRRRRVYWTNIPYPPRLPRVKDHPSTFVQSCLQNAIALEEKTGVVMGFGSDKANSCLLEHVMDIETRKMRGITQIEVEVMMGYPPNHTNLLITEAKHQTNALVQTLSKMETKSASKKKQGKISGNRGSLSQNPITPAIRWALLGNTFTVPTIGYLISPLLKGSVRVLGQPVIIPGPTKENECSVMEPYDVWALYNEHERPNWYARILKRAGDRFSRMSYGAKKHPLYIEMQYLEITTPYLEGEDDEWNPLRGTGLFELREEVDTQVAWTTFSHRVTSCLTLGDKFYVYPGKDEVWAVYSRQTWSPFFVVPCASFPVLHMCGFMNKA